MSRRGFVMPVVVLLALVGGLVVGVAMDRASQRIVITQDQLDAYRDAHRSFGLKSIIRSWLMISSDHDMNAMRGVRDRAGTAEGVIFRTDAFEGVSVAVSLQPWQGRLLTVGTGLTASDARRVELMADRLRQQADPERFEQLTRRTGPAAIDAGRAPREVILAVATAVLEDEILSDRYASALVSARRADPVDRALLLAAAERAGLDEDQRDAIDPWFTAEPRLWRCAASVTEQTSPGEAERVTRYEGLVLMPDDALASSGAVSAHELFLSWDRVRTPER